MRRTILLLLVVAGSLSGQVISTMGGVVSIPPRSIHAQNLVSEWRFDDGSGDTLNDYRGSNDGQLGSAAGADANDPDWVAAGLDFPTTGDRVVLSGLTFDPSGGPWSISIVGRHDTADSFDKTAWSQQNGTGTGRSILVLDVDTDNPCTFLGGTQQCGTQTLSTGYHHVTITYNGSGTITYYVDGDSGSTDSITPEAANGAHWIGSNKSGLGEFSDSIAWGLYYDDELNQAENNNNCKALAPHLAVNRGVTLTCN